MSNNIENNTKSNFFPSKKDLTIPDTTKLGNVGFKRNDSEKKTEIENLSKSDARVDIPDSVKDFSRIKKMVDSAPEVDNSEKIARLRQQIQGGTYSVDYEALADKILASEF